MPSDVSHHRPGWGEVLKQLSVLLSHNGFDTVNCNGVASTRCPFFIVSNGPQQLFEMFTGESTNYLGGERIK